MLPKSHSTGNNLSAQQYDKQVRVAVLGPAGVGKTSIIRQFLYDMFEEEYSQTVEEMYQVHFDNDGVKLTLDILDTAGAFEFPAMRQLAIATSHAFLLVYSVDDLESFQEVTALRQLILSQRPGTQVPIVIVGNKADVPVEKHAVAKETAEAIACFDWNNGFVEATAKDHSRVVEVFKEILRQSKISYDLSPAMKRRRQSLPVLPGQGKQNYCRAKRDSKSFMKRFFTTLK
ncbi:ras-related protein Rap-2c [Aplysia californica]|uniref:Ras-related protein Rap-2c n=1 Tax=Aplysia californica TaxID=6500 RepID=A0ABM0K4J2_APLCA|nr:ras-related protein Rap-2c [Aplysia californica]